MNLSNLIYKASKKNKIPAKIYTAILMQESRYQVSAISKACGIKPRHISSLLNKDEEEVCVWHDFGMAQINYKTARKYKFDLEQLVKDEAYSINAGAEVLSWFKTKYQKDEPVRWFVRYNCGTAKSINRPTCNAYFQSVIKWM